MQVNPVAFAERKSVLPKNIFVAIIYIIIIIFITIGVISFFSAWEITHPGKTTTPQITANIAPNYKNVSFNFGDSNEKINGWFFPSTGSKNAVLMVHSYGRNRLEFDEETFKLITRFNNEKLNVLTIDLRGSGNSSGALTTFGKNETQDVLTAIKYLKQQGIDKVILMGFSTGASACLSAVSKTPYRDSIIGVIGDSPYSTIDNYLEYKLESNRWLPRIPFDFTIEFIIRKLSKVNSDMDITAQIPAIIPTPILLIDGVQKDLPASENTRLLYELYFRRSPVQAHYWNSGAEEYGRSFLDKPGQYMDRVIEFITGCIADAAKTEAK